MDEHIGKENEMVPSTRDSKYIATDRSSVFNL